MNISAHSINNPLALIAVLAATTEASALASLPLLDVRNQQVFVWFLVGFPPFLTALFFITLNFNRQAFASGNADPHAPCQEESHASGGGSPGAPDTDAKPGHRVSDAPLTPSPFTEGVDPKPFPAQLHIVDYIDDLEPEALLALVKAWAQGAFEQRAQATPCGLMLLKRD